MSTAETSGESDKEPKVGWLKTAGKGAIALAALAGVILMQQAQLNRPVLGLEDAKQAEQQEALRLKLLKQTPSFGFDNLVADWTFLNFLQYFGDDPARSKTGYALSPDYFDIITRRDPRFLEIYMFLSGSVSYQVGKPELAVQMMQRGTDVLTPQINPKTFQVWRFKSLDQLLLLGDVPGAIFSLDKAADSVAGTPYASLDPVFRQTANFLRTDPNSKAVRVAAWGSIYQQAAMIGDKQTQERAKQEIKTLGGKIFMKDNKVFVEPPPSVPKPQPSKSPKS